MTVEFRHVLLPHSLSTNLTLRFFYRLTSAIVFADEPVRLSPFCTIRQVCICIHVIRWYTYNPWRSLLHTHTAQLHTIQNTTCHFSPHILGLGSTQALGQWAAVAQSLGIKRPEHEARHSPPPGAGTKNAWSYISILPHVFIVYCLL
jgi:hypothetical protein